MKNSFLEPSLAGNCVAKQPSQPSPISSEINAIRSALSELRDNLDKFHGQLAPVFSNLPVKEEKFASDYPSPACGLQEDLRSILKALHELNSIVEANKRSLCL